jgi:hypothetical protein
MTGRAGWRLLALLLVGVQVPVLARTGADPSQSDFSNYFTPALVLAGGGDLGALYDRDAFARALDQTGIGGLGSFVPHPPANALWLLPFASQRPEVAKGLWSIVLVGAIGLSIAAISRLSPGFPVAMAAVFVLAPVLSVRNGLAFGQPYLVLGALLAAGALALERERAFSAGFLLGLGVSFKPYALGIGALFLRRGRGRALFGFVCGAAAPSLLVWLLAGARPFVEFDAKVLPWMLRGDIQDPFSPVWGSASALANRLFRFEPDLNPDPFLLAPRVASFAGAAVSAGFLALGVVAGRRAMDLGRVLEGLGVSLAFALAASPFTASYHLVLLAIPATALAARCRERGRAVLVVSLALLGSPVFNTFRSAASALALLAYARFLGLAAIAIVLAWPFANRRAAALALAAGVCAGLIAVAGTPRLETWPRIEAAKGYTMMRPYFCGSALRWMSPTPDGRHLESRGEGADCARASAPPSPRVKVASRFTDGSWNLYLEGPSNGAVRRLTFSGANEVDPVLTPDGCAVVFASDQGRGLGSTALYRVDVSPFIPECAGRGPAAAPR